MPDTQKERKLHYIVKVTNTVSNESYIGKFRTNKNPLSVLGVTEFISYKLKNHIKANPHIYKFEIISSAKTAVRADKALYRAVNELRNGPQLRVTKTIKNSTPAPLIEKIEEPVVPATFSDKEVADVVSVLVDNKRPTRKTRAGVSIWVAPKIDDK